MHCSRCLATGSLRCLGNSCYRMWGDWQPWQRGGNNIWPRLLTRGGVWGLWGVGAEGRKKRESESAVDRRWYQLECIQKFILWSCFSLTPSSTHTHTHILTDNIYFNILLLVPTQTHTFTLHSHTHTHLDRVVFQTHTHHIYTFLYHMSNLHLHPSVRQHQEYCSIQTWPHELTVQTRIKKALFCSWS